MTDCTHEHVARVSMKHDDRTTFAVPHLEVDNDGYMPRLGIFGGDYTNFSVCLKCGQIMNWKEITDEQIKQSDEFQELFSEE